MEYSYKIEKKRFKFKQTGFFGGGDSVKVYMDGEYIDEFELSDYAIKDKGWFERECRGWLVDNASDLVNE